MIVSNYTRENLRPPGSIVQLLERAPVSFLSPFLISHGLPVRPEDKPGHVCSKRSRKDISLAVGLQKEYKEYSSSINEIEK